MEGKAKLPMGIEDFEEIRSMGYYYVDKTGLIRTLLENPCKVCLFTRPRRFGKTLNMNPFSVPQNYWVNTSSNTIVRRFIEKAKTSDRNEMEHLINGGSVRKRIRQELTYRDMDTKFDNLWSFLYMTGYLTQQGEDENGLTELIIPNREIRWIYAEQIRDWFEEETIF